MSGKIANPFNSGMIIGTGEAMNLLAPFALPALAAVRSVLDTFFTSLCMETN